MNYSHILLTLPHLIFCIWSIYCQYDNSNSEDTSKTSLNPLILSILALDVIAKNNHDIRKVAKNNS